jgi:hypothetical protein
VAPGGATAREPVILAEIENWWPDVAPMDIVIVDEPIDVLFESVVVTGNVPFCHITVDIVDEVPSAPLISVVERREPSDDRLNRTPCGSCTELTKIELTERLSMVTEEPCSPSNAV